MISQCMMNNYRRNSFFLFFLLIATLKLFFKFYYEYIIFKIFKLFIGGASSARFFNFHVESCFAFIFQSL
jgi:hypothetical protein